MLKNIGNLIATALISMAVISCAQPRQQIVMPDDMPAEAMAAFLHPDRAILYSVKPYPDIDPVTYAAINVSYAEYFHRYPVLGKTYLNAAQETEAFNAIQTMVSRWDDRAKQGIMSAAMCFNPRHGITVQKDGHRYDMLICYECAQVVVFKDEKGIATLSLLTGPGDAYPKKLNDILVSASVPLAK